MPPPRSSRAFSLIELVIVVVIMGIIAAMAVVRIGNLAWRSKIAATQESLRAIQARLDEEQAATGAWPTAVTAGMFTGGVCPRNALLPDQKTPIEVVSGTETDPADKVPADLNAGGFWYNSKLGIVRARVPWYESVASTEALYAYLNGSQMINGTTGGDKGGTGDAQQGGGFAGTALQVGGAGVEE